MAYLSWQLWLSCSLWPAFPASGLPTISLRRVIPFESLQSHSPTIHHSEKFLSYLPHSGLHNQRIALENALILGALTNRTVLVPPIRLGSKPLRYVNSDSLQHILSISGKTGLRHCSRVSARFLPPECYDYFDYTHISPAWLFNLTRSEFFPPLVFLDDLSVLPMRRRLQLPVSDIFTFRDSTPYHHRFIDTNTDTSALKHKYTESIYISDLAQYPHRLLELGTLFGSSRLRLRHENNKRIRTQVRERMEFTSPQLVATADAIVTAIGEPYVGVHVRLGDGSFKANGDENLRRLWWTLVHDILQYTVSETLHIGLTLGVFSSSEPLVTSSFAVKQSWPYLLHTDHSTGNLSCRGHRHPSPHMHRLNSPLFIATDDPANPSFSGLLRTFPCALFLSDFAVHARRVDGLLNDYDGTLMGPFLLPLLDAMVVGRAGAVAVTEGSTFSRFIHDVLWRRHHGLDIIERG